MHQGLSVINKRQYKKVINKWVVLVSVVGISRLRMQSSGIHYFTNCFWLLKNNRELKAIKMYYEIKGTV